MKGSAWQTLVWAAILRFSGLNFKNSLQKIWLALHSFHHCVAGLHVPDSPCHIGESIPGWNISLPASLPLQWRIDSAATSTYEIGSPPDDRGQACMQKHGVPMRHIARQVRHYPQHGLLAMPLFVAVDHRQRRRVRLEHGQHTRQPRFGLPQESCH